MTSGQLATSAMKLLGDAPIVVLAPHPDDESLGCGALLAAAFGHRGAHVVCVTDGGGSHPGSADWPAERIAQTRRAELTEAVRQLGGSADDITWLGLTDGGLAGIDPDPVADRIAEICDRLGSDRLFSASGRDHHADHKATDRIASLVRARRPVLRLFIYPVWSRWDEADVVDAHAPLPPIRLDTVVARDRKSAAIAAHRSQLGLVITDDPDGFAMEDGFVDMFVTSDELYFERPV